MSIFNVRQPLYKLLLVHCLSLLVMNPICSQEAGENLFRDDFLHEILFYDTDTLTYISTKDYQCVDISIDGISLDSVGLKRKGNISFYPSVNKYPLKVKTNKYVPGKKYDGIKEFYLHINFQDPSMLREKLTYDLCSELDLFSLRTAFAKVYINDLYWGLFTIVEGKDEMFKQVFDFRDMDAIESLDFGDMCYISDNPEDYNFEVNGGIPTYKLENGDPATAWPRFAGMIDKANHTEPDVYPDTVSKYLNLLHFYKLLALNVVLMNFDSYIAFRGNQIYAYDTISNIWQVIPWDFNASFGLWNTNNYIPAEYPLFPPEVTDGCIASVISTNTIIYNYYMDAVCRIYRVISDTINYHTRISELKNQIQTAVYNDTRKVISNNDFDIATEHGYNYLFYENIPGLKTFIKERIDLIESKFENAGYSCSLLSLNRTENRLPASSSIQIRQEMF